MTIIIDNLVLVNEIIISIYIYIYHFIGTKIIIFIDKNVLGDIDILYSCLQYNNNY